MDPLTNPQLGVNPGCPVCNYPMHRHPDGALSCMEHANPFPSRRFFGFDVYHKPSDNCNLPLLSLRHNLPPSRRVRLVVPPGDSWTVRG